LTRALRVLAAVVGAGLIAAACSSNGGTHTASSTTSSTTSHHSSTTTTSSSVPPTTASTTTSTTGIGPCTKVTATPGQTQGAAGTIVGTVSLAEVGAGTCTVDGYPSLTRFSASGATLPTTVVHGLTISVSGPASEPPSVIALTSTQQAEFTFQYSDVITGTETGCPMSATLSVTTPGATSASAPIPLSMTACNNGTVEVSALYASTAG
jgi:hypothetical protein